MRGLLLLLALAACLGLVRAPGASAQGTEYDNPSVLIPVDLSGAYYRYNLAIPAFQTIRADGRVNDAAQALSARLGANLGMTGFFELLDPRSSLESDPRAGVEEGRPLDYAPWAQIGANFVIKGAYEVSGSQVTMEMRLFDVALGQTRLAKRYNGPLKEARRIVNRFTNEVLLSITGEPGVFGSQIIFVVGDGSNKGIMLTELGSDEAESLAGSKGGPATQPTLGPGNKTAWTHRNGKRWELVSGGRVIHSGATVFTPAYMFDGTLAAALSGQVSTNIAVFEGKSSRPISSGGGIEISPSFSPDGRMAFVSDRGGGPAVYVSQPGSTSATRISPSGGGTDPSWSPKGDKIAFVYRERDICVVNPDGTGLIQLTGGQGRNMHPSFSPDGRMIVFSSDRGGRSQLYVMSANGDRQQPLMPDFKGGSQSLPAWSPVMPD
ncbi:MAG: hypothetical protein LBP95_02540 [Deltaproteobacteria bacterium]|nr:hypothetical protein [Deltaproteobacteria bacterium]